MDRDTIYSTPRTSVPPFEFNAAVASVFDDMIHRSVPMYGEIIRRQAQLVQRCCRPGTRVYDLGCSTGNLAMALCRLMPAGSFEMVAVDSSRPMLDICRKRLKDAGRFDDITLMGKDIRQVTLDRAGAVVVNFTLQFIPPADRDELLQKVYDALMPGGMLLFSEKTIHADQELSDLQVDFYYRLKKENGYSELEISQKREALENVLVPETMESHQDRLIRCGFSGIDVWLKWFNFCSWICTR
ncbi:carboxy-S-adenosyl-L-methionine synthase CmoA [uncultured Desulfosarcina sp.]|uniref:carboxy-S-adenosyl-L-methionine synthase CmoA n=1 Tax=uncultured Desulfosarcina sp. TaxID=218289 RepID=UPI0029C6B860|nr:carboxy-S-adenosyl-L-methionine synthase CmoA [uncultured Desulfosarcina sp.]